MPPVSARKKKIIALFNYGGGMRGLVPAHFMAKIEAETGLRMADMVDIFAGPSTGAILNAAMTRRHPDHPGRPLYRARHLVRFYEREGLNIFPPDSFREFRGILHDFNNRTLKLSKLNWLLRHGHYDPSHLGRALKALFGDARLGDSLRTLIVPAYNIDGEQLEVVEERDETGDTPARTKNNFSDRGGRAMWLKNVRPASGHLRDAGHPPPDVSLYDAVMASCAAPTYFPCHHFPVQWPGNGRRLDCTAIDGSIFDNPCISYMGAIRHHVPEDSELIMIVLGTGYTNRSYKKDDWNRYGALGVVDPVNDLPLINILFYASESALMEAFAEEMGANLYVFNKSMLPGLGRPGAPSVQIDDASPENLKALYRFYEEILEENRADFDSLCHLLVENYENKKREKGKEGQSPGRRLEKYLSFLTGNRRKR